MTAAKSSTSAGTRFASLKSPDRGQEPLRMAVVGLERPGLEEGFAAGEGDAPERRGRVESQNQGPRRQRGNGRH